MSAGDDSLWSCDKLFLAWKGYRSLVSNALSSAESEYEVKSLSGMQHERDKFTTFTTFVFSR